MRTPRSLAIFLVLLCGITRLLDAQSAPALTPGSVFYLKERVAVKTRSGITGLDPGTGVHLVSENGNTLHVTNGTNTFDVSRDKLTDKINEATVAAQNYYATEQTGAQAFNAEAARQQQERKHALEQQQLEAAQQRQRQMQQEQIAAQQQQRQLEAQQKQDAKIAAQKQAREQQQRTRRPTRGSGDRGYSWESYTRYNPGGGYESLRRSGNARMGSYHYETHSPRSPNAPSTDNVTHASWGPAPKRNKAKKHETPSPETWQQIKTAFATGSLSLRELARSMRIPQGTVLARAKREGWTREIQNAKALAKREDALAVTPVEAVAATLAERGQRHLKRMAGVSEKAVDHIEAMDGVEILDSVDQIEKLDKVARRTFGLSDSDSYGNNAIVSIAVLGIKPEEVMVEGRDA
jgi:hypothetical protein